MAENKPVALESWQAVKRSYAFVFGKLGAALRAAWLYGLVMVALAALALILTFSALSGFDPTAGPADETAAALDMPVQLDLLGFVNLVVTTVLQAAIAVAWIRFYLIQAPLPALAPPIDKRVGAFVLGQLLLGGVALLIFLPTGLVGAAVGAGGLIEIVGFVVFVYFMLRLGLILPNAALTGRLEIGKSWKATGGQVLRLFGGLFLLILPFLAGFLVIGIAFAFVMAGAIAAGGTQPFDISPGVAVGMALFSVAANLLLLLLAETFLADCYRQLLPPPDEVRHLLSEAQGE